MSQPLRWGFLGASRIGRKALAPAVQAAGQILHGVAARDPARAEEFAGTFKANAYADYAGLLDDADIDAVYIALTNDRHLPWVLRALEAGKHVLCEKPLAMNAGEVEQMIEAEAASGRLVAEAFAYRFNRQIVRLTEILASGELGRIVSAQVTFGNTMDPSDFRWHASLGGGALYDIGCYCTDLLRLIAGAEPTAVAAFQRMQGDVDATFAAALTFPAGIQGQFNCSFASARRQNLAVLGTDAMLTIDWPFAPRELAVALRVNDRLETFGPSEPYRDMVAHFADAAMGLVRPWYPSRTSLAQAQSMDALFASARLGTIERLG